MKKFTYVLLLIFISSFSVAFGEKNYEDLIGIGETEPVILSEDLFNTYKEDLIYDIERDSSVAKDNILVYKGHVYIAYEGSGDKGRFRKLFYRVNLSTGKKEDLLANATQDVDLRYYFLMDKIYLVSERRISNDDSIIYSMNLDGSNFVEVARKPVEKIHFYQDKFYFDNSNAKFEYEPIENLYEFNPQTQQTTLIAENVVSTCLLKDGFLYLTDTLYSLEGDQWRAVHSLYDDIFPIHNNTNNYLFVRDNKVYQTSLFSGSKVYIGEGSDVYVYLPSIYSEVEDHTNRYYFKSSKDEHVLNVQVRNNDKGKVFIKNKGILYDTGFTSFHKNLYNFMLTDNYLYLVNENNRQLYQIDLATYEKSIIKNASAAKIAGKDQNYVYYLSNRKLMRMSHDAMNPEILIDNVKSALFLEGLLVYNDMDHQTIHVYDPEKAKIIDSYSDNTIDYIREIASDGENLVFQTYKRFYIFNSYSQKIEVLDTTEERFTSIDDGVLKYIEPNENRDLFYIKFYNLKTKETTSLYNETIALDQKIFGEYRNDHLYYIAFNGGRYTYPGGLRKINIHTLEDDYVFDASSFDWRNRFNSDKLLVKNNLNQVIEYIPDTNTISKEFVARNDVITANDTYTILRNLDYIYGYTYDYNTSNDTMALSDTSSNPIVFLDVKASDKALNEAVTRLKLADIVTGSNDLLNPDDYISRAETAAILYRLLESMDFNFSDINFQKFEDVSLDAWYYKPVHTVRALDLFGGTGSNNFSPNDPITDTQLALVLSKANCFYKDFKLPEKYDSMAWDQVAQKASKEFGIISQSKRLKNQPLTRRDAFIMLDKVYSSLKKEYLKIKTTHIE